MLFFETIARCAGCRWPTEVDRSIMAICRRQPRQEPALCNLYRNCLGLCPEYRVPQWLAISA